MIERDSHLRKKQDGKTREPNSRVRTGLKAGYSATPTKEAKVQRRKDRKTQTSRGSSSRRSPRSQISTCTAFRSTSGTSPRVLSHSDSLRSPYENIRFLLAPRDTVSFPRLGRKKRSRTTKASKKFTSGEFPVRHHLLRRRRTRTNPRYTIFPSAGKHSFFTTAVTYILTY